MSEQSKDLVLNINEYAYVLDKTKGNIVCWTGPSKTSLSNSDALVRFDERSKEFIECTMNEAISIQPTAPENWYMIMKNPAPNNAHPKTGASSGLPDAGLNIGKKINIPGPVSFPPYPGQMIKVVKGHTLRSNQYLVVRVYEANEAAANQPRYKEYNLDNLSEDDGKREQIPYVNGELIIIKGTEKSFYIPPTGFEVVAENGEYIRDAVTLERLEYCILKDENGKKRYMHGPDVVFPNPTEVFIENPQAEDTSDRFRFKAVELTETSGVYVKVIADYTDEDGVSHKTGEELFITGKDKMIYYPRPEHTLITYGEDTSGKYYAVAIPEGEGRYVMNKLSGEIRTVVGPTMLLPDPRTEVIVRRVLTYKQCCLWYPGNKRALIENGYPDPDSLNADFDSDSCMLMSYNNVTAGPGNIKSNRRRPNNTFGRSATFTEPRSIVIDNKFKGVVSIDIWTGYAVNVISKSGNRKVVCGPKTIVLNYDESLEVLELSSGKPKTTDNLIQTVFLRTDNNKVTDIIKAETSDYVKVEIKLSYDVNFLAEYESKWFSVENYVKFLCDRMKSLIREEVRNYPIEWFFQNYTEIIRTLVRGSDEKGTIFKENGMWVYDCDVMSLNISKEIEEMLINNNLKIIQKNLSLTAAEKEHDVDEKLHAIKEEKAKMDHQEALDSLMRAREIADKKYEDHIEDITRAAKEEKDALMREKDSQKAKDDISKAEIARGLEVDKAIYEARKNFTDIEISRMDKYSENIQAIFNAISPELIASINEDSRRDILSHIAESVSPFSMAKGESVADTINTLIRGTGLDISVSPLLNNLKSLTCDMQKTDHGEIQTCAEAIKDDQKSVTRKKTARKSSSEKSSES